MSKISISIPGELHSELERLGVVLAYMVGNPTPYTPESLLVMAAEQLIYRMREKTDKSISDALIPASMELLAGKGKLICTIGQYIEKKEIRIKVIQESSKVPVSTLYAIAAGERMPSIDVLLRLLPGLHYPSLDEIFYRAP